ncbi:MAG: hypothetical protein IJO74_01900 [Clostridia bacterium]|nr:hypothetical protein [Clostridia bacterium]
MRNIFNPATLLIIAFLILLFSGKDKVTQVFCGNTGLDDLSGAVETAISENPIASQVFNMESNKEQKWV